MNGFNFQILTYTVISADAQRYFGLNAFPRGRDALPRWTDGQKRPLPQVLHLVTSNLPNLSQFSLIVPSYRNILFRKNNFCVQSSIYLQTSILSASKMQHVFFVWVNTGGGVYKVPMVVAYKVPIVVAYKVLNSISKKRSPRFG